MIRGRLRTPTEDATAVTSPACGDICMSLGEAAPGGAFNTCVAGGRLRRLGQEPSTHQRELTAVHTSSSRWWPDSS